MGREGTQVLFNTLLISNIGKYVCKNGQLTVIVCRNVKPCLSH